jgi:tetratricopeptide (TPR) repeat protein
MEVAVTGTEAAWRLEMSWVGHREQLYAALDRGAAKLVGSATNADGLGRHALRLLARGDLASAAHCIDWLIQDSPRSAALLAKIWGPGRPRDREAIALAGTIAAGASDADRLIATATRCPSTLPDAREVCDRALAIALSGRKRWRELEAHAVAWAGRAADTRLATRARVDALAGLGRYDEADQVLEALRAASPNDSMVADLWPRIAIQRADFAEAVRRYDALLQRPGADPSDRNSAAWLRLFTETDLSVALDLARKAAGPDRERGPAAALNTLAVIEAELGDLGPAVLDGWQAMGNAGRATPGDADWYLYGRISEQLGLRDDAIAAYRRVAPDPDPNSSHTLAKRRLAKLDVKP